jgi:hypothetical protein
VPGEHGGVLVCRNCGQTLTADDEGRGCKRCNWYEEWEEGEPSEWVQIVYGDRRPVGINQSERDVRAAESRRNPDLAWVYARPLVSVRDSGAISGRGAQGNAVSPSVSGAIR